MVSKRCWSVCRMRMLGPGMGASVGHAGQEPRGATALRDSAVGWVRIIAQGILGSSQLLFGWTMPSRMSSSWMTDPRQDSGGKVEHVLHLDAALPAMYQEKIHHIGRHSGDVPTLFLVRAAQQMGNQRRDVVRAIPEDRFLDDPFVEVVQIRRPVELEVLSRQAAPHGIEVMLVELRGQELLYPDHLAFPLTGFDHLGDLGGVGSRFPEIHQDKPSVGVNSVVHAEVEDVRADSVAPAHQAEVNIAVDVGTDSVVTDGGNHFGERSHDVLREAGARQFPRVPQYVGQLGITIGQPEDVGDAHLPVEGRLRNGDVLPHPVEMSPPAAHELPASICAVGVLDDTAVAEIVDGELRSHADEDTPFIRIVRNARRVEATVGSSRGFGVWCHNRILSPFARAGRRPASPFQWQGRHNPFGVPGGRFRCLAYGFQTSQTLPGRSGPGVSVTSPGCQPEGVTSPVATTCWKALSCRISSPGLLPTSGVSTSIARTTNSGSMMKRPRISTPAASS